MGIRARPSYPAKGHLATAAWSVALALLLLLPPSTYPPTGEGWILWLFAAVPFVDKIAHALLFGVLALLLARSLELLGVARRATMAALGAASYGALLDLFQAFIPGRATEGLDMIANTVGAILGAIMASSIWPTYRVSESRGAEPKDSPP